MVRRWAARVVEFICLLAGWAIVLGALALAVTVAASLPAILGPMSPMWWWLLAVYMAVGFGMFLNERVPGNQRFDAGLFLLTLFALLVAWPIFVIAMMVQDD